MCCDIKPAVEHEDVTHGDGRVLSALLLHTGVKENVPAAALTVLVDDEADLSGFQLWKGPARGREGESRLSHSGDDG